MYRLAIFVLAASVAAEVYVESECPEPKPIDNFNYDAYGQGKWYEVARYPNRKENDGNCGYAEYIRDGDIIKVKNVHVAGSKLELIEGTGRVADNAGKSGILQFNLPYGPSGAETKNIFRILATDYDHYSIGYYCHYNEEKKIRQDFAWVLSRTKKLDDATKTIVENFIKESKVLDSSKFVWPDFSDAACKFEN